MVLKMMASKCYLKLDFSLGIYHSLILSKYLLTAYFVSTGIVGKMTLPVQDSHLALTAPTVYIIRAYLHTYGTFTHNRVAARSRKYLPRGGVRGHSHSLLSLCT